MPRVLFRQMLYMPRKWLHLWLLPREDRKSGVIPESAQNMSQLSGWWSSIVLNLSIFYGGTVSPVSPVLSSSEFSLLLTYLGNASKTFPFWSMTRHPSSRAAISLKRLYWQFLKFKTSLDFKALLPSKEKGGKLLLSASGSFSFLALGFEVFSVITSPEAPALVFWVAEESCWLFLSVV